MNNTVETQSVTSLNSLYDQILVNGTLLMNRVQTVAKKLDVYCCLLYTCILYGIGRISVSSQSEAESPSCGLDFIRTMPNFIHESKFLIVW